MFGASAESIPDRLLAGKLNMLTDKVGDVEELIRKKLAPSGAGE